MKLTTLLTLVVSLNIMGTVYPQNTRFTYDFSGQTVREVFRVLEQQSRFRFFYNDDFRYIEKVVNLRVNDETVEQIMDKLFDESDITYRILENNLIVLTVRQGQQIQISGIVKDPNGTTIPGVNIIEKGTSNGTITDLNGFYSIDVASDDAILVFSYVGYLTKEVEVKGKNEINLTLVEDIETLEEVVVVGYGTIKKTNLTGSVDNISGTVLSKRPVTNSGNLLQGRLTGLEVIQPSAEPGNDQPAFMIRGKGSYGGSTNPLILIDGVSGSLNDLSPNDIESVTVLKDAASASIYGARAANGVIMITTRKGKKGDPVISYSGNISIHSPTRIPDFIYNSAEYMEMWNQARLRSNGVNFTYSEADIDSFRYSTSHDLYPNFNSVDYWFRNATVHNHNLSVSGGGETSLYNVSFNYLDQEAMLPGYKYKRYNVLLNYSNDIKKWLTLGTSINLTYKDRHEPPFTGTYLALLVYAAGPTYGPYMPDGSGRIASRAYMLDQHNRNVSEAYAMGYKDTREYNLNPQAFIDIKPFKGMVWSTKIAVKYDDEFFKMHQYPYKAYLTIQKNLLTGEDIMATYGPDIVGVTDQYSKKILPTLYSVANYEISFGSDHNFNVLAGYEQISYKSQGLQGRRVSSVSPSISELTGYLPEDEQLFYDYIRLPGLPNPSEWAMQSLFGRINYGYRSKYLFEANLRYDGTSKVSPGYRWGLFPSMSAGWVISEEGFIKNHAEWLNTLKLRTSYGVLGNQDIGTYLYQEILDINAYYPLGNTLTQGAVNRRFMDQSLRWETTRILDLGLDLDIKNGLFGFVFDWFDKYTYDILGTRKLPKSLGLEDPKVNDGEMRNRGVEIELTHRQNIGKFYYNTSFQVSSYNNELVFIRVPETGDGFIQESGLPYNSHYLYIWDGIFQEADIESGDYPVHLENLSPRAGDLKMKDLDGNDTVDSYDRQVVNGAYPDFIYSFGMDLSYKNWNLSFFFQGVKGRKSRLEGWGIEPFAQGAPPTAKWRDAWTPENPTSTLPALYMAGYPAASNYHESTYFLQDASYLRLKNVIVSYRFPENLISRIKCKELILFVSGDNLLTFTKFEGQDPERAISGRNSEVYAAYPQARIINFGLNVKF